MSVQTPAAPPIPVELEQIMRHLEMPYARSLAPELFATAKTQRWEPAEIVKALLDEEIAGRARSMLAARRKAWKRRPDTVTRGVLAKFRALVTTASRGAVTDAELG